jgi:hypothetical protein
MSDGYKLIESIAAESMAFAANAPTEIQAGLSKLLTILQKPVIDLFKLRALILAQGLPPPKYCGPSLRPLVWKLLLGMIPPVRAEWAARLESDRKTYEEYVYELVHEPELVGYLRQGVSSPSSKGAATVDEEGIIPLDRIATDDHPLAPPDSPSRWRRYWKDSEIFDQVNKDIFRTRPDMDFFSENTDDMTNAVTVRGRAVSVSDLEGQPTSPKSQPFKVANVISPKTHYDRICRILFLYAKLNFGYVQGMNEIAAPLYYTFYNDPVDGHFVEADTFFALTAVMQEQRDIFCKNLDESSAGMRGRLDKVGELLERDNPELSDHLKAIGVKIDYFALRWIMLLFAQEFNIQSIQILWDSIFSDQTPTTKLNCGQNLLVTYICVAMIVKVGVVIADGDFSEVMRTLKKYPPFEPRVLLKSAMILRRGNVKNESIFSTVSEDALTFIVPEMFVKQPVPLKQTVSGKGEKSQKTSLRSKVMGFVSRRKGASKHSPSS